MSAKRVGSRVFLGTVLLALAVITAGCATGHPMMGNVHLSGANENPPVSTKASGVADIKVGADRSVSGKLVVSGMDATAAHIHQGPTGMNGPVVIPLKKTGSDTFEVPPGTKFTEAQYAAYEGGHLYINVHSAAHKPGEIRGQLKP